MSDARLSRSFAKGSPWLSSRYPLEDDQIRRVAPSIFAAEAHGSRSDRYTYIPTIEVLNGLRGEGFQPFMVAQTRVRVDDRRDFTKHMIRLRKPDQIHICEANEVILLNSHDGTSSYQMLGGVLRFVCMNGMVCGKDIQDVRVPHKGNVVHEVIEGAYSVVEQFDKIEAQKDGMRSLALPYEGQRAFATAALALRYDPEDGPAPIESERLLTVRRSEDRASDLWTTFNRVQENMTQGGLSGHSASGRRMHTRPMHGIGENVKINRALWVLAEEMRKIAA